jgi:photosystem II stability/assembly factor-like uncharacterized protein
MVQSTDGQTWTALTPGLPVSNTFGVAYGNGTWVAGGYNGKMAYSTDGENWTEADITGFASLGVAYGNGKWVAVGQQGKMAYSTDGGVTWTLVTDSGFGTTHINGVAYGGGRFVAVGKDGKMAYSNPQE